MAAKASRPVRQSPARLTLPGVDKKIGDTNNRVSGLEKRFATDIASVQQRLGGHDGKFKHADKRHDQLKYVVAKLGERLAEDHDTIVQELTPRLKRLEELLNEGTSVNLAAAIVGFESEEIRQILDLNEDEALDNATFATALVTQIGSIRKQLDTVIDTVAENRSKINKMEPMVDRHESLLGKDGEHFTRVSKTVEALTDNNGAFKLAILGGTIVGVVVWLLGWYVAYHATGNHGNVTDKTGKTVIGTWHSHALTYHHQWASFWDGLFSGAIIGALVFLVVYVIGHHRSVKRVRTQTTVVTKSKTPDKEEVTKTQELDPVE